MLKPLLQHNLEEFDRLNTRKKQALAGLILCGVLLVFLTPAQRMGTALILYLVVVATVFLTFEAKKALVFRRDLDEREGSAHDRADR